MNLKTYLRGLGIGITVTAIIMLVIAHQNKNTAMTDEEIKARASELGMVEEENILSNFVADGDLFPAPGKETDDKDDGDASDPAASDPDDASDPDTGDNADAAADPAAEQTPEPEAEPSAEPTAEPTPVVIEPVIVEESPTPEPTKEPTPEPTKEPVIEKTPEPTKEPVIEKTPEPTPEPEPAEKPKSSAAGDTNFTIGKGEDSYTVAKHLESAGIIPSAGDFDRYLCSTGADRKLAPGTYSVSAEMTDSELASILTGH